MLTNIYRQKPAVVPGTRILVDHFGVVGRGVRDPEEPTRLWTLENAYDAIPRQGVGGIRVKARDQKGFVTFINQRDLEVLLGLARPGEWCEWAGATYPAPGDSEWFGFCADDADLEDDLFEAELALRETAPVLPPGVNIQRRAHYGKGLDRLETWVLIRDADLATGASPDPRFATLTRRWSLVERERLYWERINE